MSMFDERSRRCSLSTAQGEVDVAFRVQRRRGLRHLRVVVDERNEILLKVPYGIAEQRAVEFLHSQGEWVVKILRSTPPATSLHSYLKEHTGISIRGNAYRLEINDSEGRMPQYAIDHGKQSCGLEILEKEEIDPQLVQLLRYVARETIPGRVHELADRHHLRVGRITVRDQRTRWGSCSARGCISLNWRLLLLSPPLHDYIILHELAHLTHLNHSRKFWDLLYQYDAECARHDKEITFQSRILMRLGR